MLFSAKIDQEALKDENLLCEQLYIFLNKYVPKRLVYQSNEDIKDCVQDTIMYMLDRYKALHEEDLEIINIEKFFYNRAKSFISLYIRGIQRRKDTLKRYMDYIKYENPINYFKDKPYVDIIEIDNIIIKYKLPKAQQSLLRKLVVNTLFRLGYGINKAKITKEEMEKVDPSKAVLTLSYTIVDEYLIEEVTDRGGGK